MKKLLLNTLLLFVASIFSSTTIVGQIMPPLKNSVFVYPSNPTVKDSIYVAYSYISNDGCPDFTLVKDSVVNNRIFISKKTVDNSNLICTAAFTNFVTKLNLGLLDENTEIYFEGVFIKTINFDCIKDKIGLVVAYKDSSTIVKDSLTGDIYAINDAQLAIGTKIRFKGTKIQCITTPCYNIVNCYEVIENPVCLMDKTGIVVPGVDGCTGQIFIQEYSPISSSRQLYIIKGDVVTSDGTISIGLKVGDKVKFGGYLSKNDSSTSILCRTVGVATCYEVISTPPLCIMDKEGSVIAYKDSLSLIKETITGDIYAIKYEKLPIETKIRFKGTKIQCITAPCYNIVDCYEVISTPPCVMDKVGTVVAGIDGCTGQFFIQEYSSDNSKSQFYRIENGNIFKSDGTTSFGLKEGDKVKFGGYLTKNDSSQMNLCHIDGVATCYELISTPPGCVMDKVGEVVAGIENCAGQLFIEDTSYIGMNMIRQLYLIKDSSSTGAITLELKKGDKVRFGGYFIKNDSTLMNLCRVVGVATCYEVINPENTFSLTGSVIAGTDLLTSGHVVLFRKGKIKATAVSVITDSTFIFKNLPKAEYTVYVIPDRAIYKTYLPTFYINKLLFKKADYFTLNENVENIVVNLRHFVLPTGTGKISGNIFFETYSLKDSLLSTNGSSSLVVNTTAINTQVLLFDSNNEPVAWTITDQFGNYVFENIALDTYKVVAETASAYAESVVVLTDNSTVLNVDLLLKSQQAETGINDIENTEIKIYPNPVVDNLNIYSKEATTMELYNVLGKLLVRENLISGNNVLDLSQISKGIYFTKIGKMTIKLVKK